MELRVYSFTSSQEKVIEQIVNTDEVQINHIILPPEEKVPEHYTNSNVHLIVVKGKMTLIVEGEPQYYPQGSIIGLPYHVRMLIENRERENLEIFVVKAPHPGKYSPKFT
ncbi:MAG: cupin domain-containing protein [Candidatus Caldatribacteriaceae bacterium]